jgi:predicted thioesterase
MESAAVVALRGHLPPGQTTVGGHIDVRHLAATPVGMQVRAYAELIAIDDRKLVFKVQAWDEIELIGEADHDRFMVDEAKFMAKAGIKNRNKK